MTSRSFFSNPLEGMFTSFGTDRSKHSSTSKGVVIEEISPGDEGNPMNSSTTKPSVEHHPHDDAVCKQMRLERNADHPMEQLKTTKQSFIYRKVSYGGVDGTYYTSSMERNTGINGVILEERREADTTTGEASHMISRGLNDKGHSVTRKMNSEGKVDTMHTLHNLEEDELGAFECAWTGNAQKHLAEWMGRPTGDAHRRGEGNRRGESSSSYGRRSKKVVTINVE